jgi:hypothetical protein
MSTRNAFASERNTVVTLGFASLVLTLVLVAIPLLLAPALT